MRVRLLRRIWIALALLLTATGTAADDLAGRLTLHRATTPAQQAPWVLILPGGGYVRHAVPKEGADIAAALNARGLNAAVLQYRLPKPVEGEEGVARPLRDVRDALAVLRAEIGEQRLGIMGFSAGGHLAAMAATNAAHLEHLTAAPWRAPDFVALLYPVVTLTGPDRHVGSTTALLGETPSASLLNQYDVLSHLETPPPLFVVHGRDDLKVPFSHAQRLWQLLTARERSAIFMIEVADGAHGFALRQTVRDAVWFDQFVTWALAPPEGHHYETTYLSQP